MTEQNKDIKKEFEKLYGEAEVTVTTREGKTEKVKVRALPLRELREYTESQDDDSALAELLTGKEIDFIDKLTDESVYAIVDKGRELNHPRMANWVKRRAQSVKKLEPLLEETRSISQTFAPKSK